MDYFNYRDQQLFAEDAAVSNIAAQHGTPLYIYSRATLERHWHAFNDAFEGHPHLVCFAVKANSNLAVLNVLARMGSGFDIVSVGELERVLAAGGDAGKVLFSGVGKQAHEMRRALEVGIRCFNVESEAELQRLNQVAAEMGVQAPVSLRVNPDVDAKTHPYISTGLKENKFGVAIDDALEIYRHAQQLSHINVVGVDCHIGSQLTELAPFLDALERVLLLVRQLADMGIDIQHLDLGGGLGVRYRDEQPPEPSEYASAIRERLEGAPYEILIEPGRAIAANAGILVTRVEYLKPTPDKHFAVIDAAMNDLIRPSLYQAWQEIIPVDAAARGVSANYDLVGPICETGDFLGKQRELSLSEGELLAVRSSGAYGFTMASNYNSRPRAAEIMVDGDQVFVVRERETIEQLFAGESLLP
ncbi:MAG: diaminopimelate decarboxylase [Chromatiales bacterium]|jgi:diaminopimelate decarboxylase